MTAPQTRRPTLMVVHAHPDDDASQTGGTLARYADAGVRTVLVTCTDGALGDGAGSSKPGHREHEPAQVGGRTGRPVSSLKAVRALAEAALGPDAWIPRSMSPSTTRP